MALEQFAEATRTWFAQSLGTPTPVQVRGWASIARGHHTLMTAPTGSGKTLAAFLWCIDRLAGEPATRPTTRVLYVSPLKALGVDVERNLRAPLVGITQTAAHQGRPVPRVRVGVRSGDTPAAERRRLQQQLAAGVAL